MKKTWQFSCIVAAIIPMLISCSPDENKSDAYGNFEAKEITVSAQAQGEVLKMEIEKGDKLSEGQVVGQIDTTSLHLQRAELKAQKRKVLANLANLEAKKEVEQQQLENAKTTLRRIENLMAGNAATQKQLDDVEGKIKLVRKQIEATVVSRQSIMAELEVIEAKKKQLADRIQKATIKNPVKGTVINKFVENGELVTPGTPLYKIANLQYLDLKVYISGAEIPHVKLGQKVQVLIDEDHEKNRELTGEVVWIADEAEFTPKVIQTKEERVKLVYAVKVRVQNDGALKIGMPGEVNF